MSPLLETFGNASARGFGSFLPTGSSALPSYELIATTSLSSTTTTVTFSSIPSTYKHLQLRISSSTTTGNNLRTYALKFNSTANTPYSSHYLSADPSMYTGYVTDADYIYLTTAGDVFGSVFKGGSIVDILDYTNTNKNTTTKAFNFAAFGNGSSRVQLSSGGWRNNSVVNAIYLQAIAGDAFTVNSRFSLYGILG